MPTKMTKEQLKTLFKKLFIRNPIEENSVAHIRAMNKKELKEYINTHGGFTKGKLNLKFKPSKVNENGEYDIPEWATYFEAVLSDESINMNGYRILLSAWEAWFKAYFNDWEWSVYLQHDMDQPIWKTLKIWVDEETKQLKAIWYYFDDLTQKRVSRGLIIDVSTGHIPLEVVYINKDTDEVLSIEEFEGMIYELIDQYWDWDLTYEELQEEIKKLTEVWVETHIKVQICEYSLVSVWANKQWQITKMNNAIEKINNELPEWIEKDQEETSADVVQPEEPNALPKSQEEYDALEKEEKTEEEEEAEEEIVEEEEAKEVVEEIPTEEDPTTEEHLENEGETPEGSQDIPEQTPETVEEDQEKVQLENKVQELESKVQELEQLAEHKAGRKVIVTHDVKEESNEKSIDEIRYNVWRLLRGKSV